MLKFIIIILSLIFVQGFSQVKEINFNEFDKLNLNKSVIYDGDSYFEEIRTHFITSIDNKFYLIELDTITNQLHITGKITPSREDKILRLDINLGEIISEDENGMTMKFTHYFYTNSEGNYDISFVIDNENTLLSFNRNETLNGSRKFAYSKIYNVGKLLK